MYLSLMWWIVVDDWTKSLWHKINDNWGGALCEIGGVWILSQVLSTIKTKIPFKIKELKLGYFFLFSFFFFLIFLEGKKKSTYFEVI
jgi:hypothetical protein